MLKKLTQRVYYLPYEKYRDRPTLGYIQGDRLALQVDAGSSKDHVRLMLNSLGKLPPPQLAVMTHAHWDHTYGIHAFPGVTLASRKTQELLNEMAQWVWTPGHIARRIAQGQEMLFSYDTILKEYDDLAQIQVTPADIGFDGVLTMDLGNCPVSVIPMENSHNPDCVVVHLPSEGVIFLGDIYYEDLLTQPPCYYRPKHEALRDALAALPFDLCVPGHHEVMSRDEFFKEMDRIWHIAKA